MSDLTITNFVVTTATTADLYTRAESLDGGNTVEVTAEAVTITQDTALVLEVSNDGQNWAYKDTIGILTMSTLSIAGQVTRLAARFYRLRLRMSGSGTAIVAATACVSEQ